MQPFIPYGQKNWREDILANCWNYVIWQNYFDVWACLSRNNIRNKMANQMHWEFNRAMS